MGWVSQHNGLPDPFIAVKLDKLTESDRGRRTGWRDADDE